MSLKIGVSGVRGIIGDSLTEEVIGNFAKAYGTFVSSRGTARRAPTILIGRDTRQSGGYVRKVVIDGLVATGCKVTDVGLCTTPAALFLTRFLKADGAIVITASHNLAQWNGLKFVRPDGTFLTKKEIEKLIKIYSTEKFALIANKKGGNITEKPDAIKAHLDRVIKSVDVKAIKRAKFKVAVDYCNGTGAVTTPYLLKKLGCEVVAINTYPDGKFAHNPEPTAKNLEQLAKFVKETKADVGFAQDPDADRLAVVSEKGVPIGEENTLALAVKHVLSKSASKRGQAAFCYKKKSACKKQPVSFLKVVVNLSTSRMIDDICSEFGAILYRSAVGETNVVDKMRAVGAVVGGEGNGGVIFPSVNFGRDSFIGMALILEYMAKTDKKLSDLVGGIKQYCIEKIKIDCPQEKAQNVLDDIRKYVIANCRDAINRVSTIDGVKIDYPAGWVHIRGSNTEPVIRIMAEAPTRDAALEYINRIKGLIQC